ncbi:MAG: hypothetical protein ACI4QF_01825 [Kiritimatiellia bacterium]
MGFSIPSAASTKSRPSPLPFVHQGLAVYALSHQLARFLRGGHRRQIDAPTPVVTGERFDFGAGEFDGNALARRGAPPHGDGAITLQNHGIGKRTCQTLRNECWVGYWKAGFTST